MFGNTPGQRFLSVRVSMWGVGGGGVGGGGGGGGWVWGFGLGGGGGGGGGGMYQVMLLVDRGSTNTRKQGGSSVKHETK